MNNQVSAFLSAHNFVNHVDVLTVAQAILDDMKKGLRKEGGDQSVNDNHGSTMQEGYGDIFHGRRNDNGRGILRGIRRRHERMVPHAAAASHPRSQTRVGQIYPLKGPQGHFRGLSLPRRGADDRQRHPGQGRLL